MQIAERLKSHAAATGSQPSRAPAPQRPVGHQGQPGSLSALRKQLAAAKALQAARAAAAGTASKAAAAGTDGAASPAEEASAAANDAPAAGSPAG